MQIMAMVPMQGGSHQNHTTGEWVLKNKAYTAVWTPMQTKFISYHKIDFGPVVFIIAAVYSCHNMLQSSFLSTFPSWSWFSISLIRLWKISCTLCGEKQKLLNYYSSNATFDPKHFLTDIMKIATPESLTL